MATYLEMARKVMLEASQKEANATWRVVGISAAKQLQFAKCC